MKEYKLIPFSEIDDEAREIACAWVDKYGNMGIDIQNRHKLASDIINYHRSKLSETESLPADVKEGAILYCNEFHKGGDRTYRKCYESFLAGYQHQLTQNTAKDKEKDELLRDMATQFNFCKIDGESWKKAYPESRHGFTDKMMADVDALLTRYNSLTSSNTSTEEQIEGKEDFKPENFLNEYQELENVSEEDKIKFADAATSAAGKILLFAFKTLGLAQGMGCTIYNEPTNEAFKLSFIKEGEEITGKVALRMFSKDDLYKCALEFFYHWYNAPGKNTAQGLQEWLPKWIAEQEESRIVP